MAIGRDFTIMVQYPDCPYCDNANTALSIVDVEINGSRLKGIICNNCDRYLGFFQDNTKELEEIKDRIDDLESDVSDFK